jgi:hypothetical protein
VACSRAPVLAFSKLCVVVVMVPGSNNTNHSVVIAGTVIDLDHTHALSKSSTHR